MRKKAAMFIISIGVIAGLAGCSLAPKVPDSVVTEATVPTVTTPTVTTEATTSETTASEAETTTAKPKTSGVTAIELFKLGNKKLYDGYAPFTFTMYSKGAQLFSSEKTQEFLFATEFNDEKQYYEDSVLLAVDVADGGYINKDIYVGMTIDEINGFLTKPTEVQVNHAGEGSKYLALAYTDGHMMFFHFDENNSGSKSVSATVYREEKQR